MEARALHAESGIHHRSREEGKAEIRKLHSNRAVAPPGRQNGPCWITSECQQALKCPSFARCLDRRARRRFIDNPARGRIELIQQIDWSPNVKFRSFNDRVPAPWQRRVRES